MCILGIILASSIYHWEEIQASGSWVPIDEYLHQAPSSTRSRMSWNLKINPQKNKMLYFKNFYTGQKLQLDWFLPMNKAQYEMLNPHNSGLLGNPNRTVLKETYSLPALMLHTDYKNDKACLGTR